nr:14820_t:CDS:2 [Entrophospora candida]
MSDLLSTTQTEDFERFLEQKDFDSWLQEETSLNEGYLNEHNKTEDDGSNIDSTEDEKETPLHDDDDVKEIESLLAEDKIKKEVEAKEGDNKEIHEKINSTENGNSVIVNEVILGEDDETYVEGDDNQVVDQVIIEEEIEGLLSIKGLLSEQSLQHQQQINLFEKETPLHDDDDNVKEIESLLAEDKIKKEVEAKEGDNKEIHEKINSTENGNSVIVNEVILGEVDETYVEGGGNQVIDQVINDVQDGQIIDDEHQIHVDDHVNGEILYEEESMMRTEATGNLETKIDKNNVLHHSRTMSGERFRCILAYEGNENPIFIKSDKIVGEFMEDLKVDLICDENLIKDHEVVLTFIDSVKDFELILTEDNKYADKLTLGNIIEAHKGFQKLYNIVSSDLVIMVSLQVRFISRFQQFFNDNESYEAQEPILGVDDYIENNDLLMDEFELEDSLLMNDNNNFKIDGFNFSRKRERSPGPDNEGIFKKRINV